MWKPIILDVECIICNKSLQRINHQPRSAVHRMGKITNSRRSRTPNWSSDEKQYLLELIRNRKEVVVPKSNNGPNHSEEKDIAWNEILHELAVKFGNKFSGSSIKKVKTQWQNMKRIAREEIVLNGSDKEKFTKQSVEVCNILDLVKDGVIHVDGEGLNDTTITTNIEIKSECIDEEMSVMPGCSGINNNRHNCNQQNQLQCSESSVSEHEFVSNEFEVPNSNQPVKVIAMKNVSIMTEPMSIEDESDKLDPLQKQLQEFFMYTATEKQIKMESLKEERQVIRAMRETAELNKIIAEQKLKHVLWVKKQEMSMYSGEPGSGAGKGGGGGGAIREAGGTFGKMEAAREDEYFYKKQKEQLQNMKGHLDKEISFHQEQIKRHEDAIRRHKQQMSEMDKK